MSPKQIKKDLRPAELREVVDKIIPLLEPLARKFPRAPDVQMEVRRCRNLIKGKPSEGTDFTGLPYFSKTIHCKHNTKAYCLLAACFAFVACYYDLFLKRDNEDYDWEKNRRRFEVLRMYLQNLEASPIESWEIVGGVKTGFHLKVSTERKI